MHITPEFFARHGLHDLRRQSDAWLEQQGRVAQPVILREGASHFEPIGWEEAFAKAAERWPRGEPFLGDRLPASLADAVGGRVHPAQRVVDLGDPLPGSGQQRGQLGAFEADGGALRVVLVVGVRVARRREQRLQIAGQGGRLGLSVRAQPRQRRSGGQGLGLALGVRAQPRQRRSGRLSRAAR